MAVPPPRRLGRRPDATKEQQPPTAPPPRRQPRPRRRHPARPRPRDLRRARGLGARRDVGDPAAAVRDRRRRRPAPVLRRVQERPLHRQGRARGARVPHQAGAAAVGGAVECDHRAADRVRARGRDPAADDRAARHALSRDRPARRAGPGDDRRRGAGAARLDGPRPVARAHAARGSGRAARRPGCATPRRRRGSPAPRPPCWRRSTSRRAAR